jgi:hypothetical protein
LFGSEAETVTFTDPPAATLDGLTTTDEITGLPFVASFLQEVNTTAKVKKRKPANDAISKTFFIDLRFRFEG